MHHVTLDNTQGYTPGQLEMVNHLIDLAIGAHLTDSVYDTGDTLDIATWILEAPDDYQGICERVIARFDTDHNEHDGA